jgi:hypothetical protein
MSAVLGAFDTVVSLMNKVWELMTSNPGSSRTWSSSPWSPCC